MKTPHKIPNKKFTLNNFNDRLVAPLRGQYLNGQAPTYSTMQIKTLKPLTNINISNDSRNNGQLVVSTTVQSVRDNTYTIFRSISAPHDWCCILHKVNSSLLTDS